MENVNESDEIHLKIYLYSDKDLTEKISDSDVVVNISYDVENAITVYSDVAILNYRLWGEKWDFDLFELITTVNLPTDNYSYYIFPDEFNLESENEGNTIYSVSNGIYSGNFLQLNVLMPVGVFENASHVNHIQKNNKEYSIIEIQAYELFRASFSILSVFILIYSLCLPFIMIFVYLKYGREPKVNYDGIYERELPSDDSPVFVNALYGSGYEIGFPDIDGFEATILDLINRDALKVEYVDDDHIYLKQKKVCLKKHEKMLIESIFQFSNKEKEINLCTLEDIILEDENPKIFKDNFEKWKEYVHDVYFNDEKLSKYYNDKGTVIHRLLKEISTAFLALCIVAAFKFTFSFTVFYLMSALLPLLVESIILFFLPDDILGCWTEYGRVYHLKWSNFKKFLKSNSLISEYPPKSIVIWDNYLVYGTALGIADKVNEELEAYIPKNDKSNLMLAYESLGFIFFNNTLAEALFVASKSDNGGFSAGGGGGGGAF